MTKLAPVTVMVLPTYADAGAMEVAVGSALTVSVVPATVATLAPFVNVTSTDDAAAAVPAPITTVAEVALTYVHVAAVPELGVAPTFAVHAALTKLAPVTVMVLPTYAEVGAMEVAVGTAAIDPESMPGEDTIGSPLVAIVTPVTLPAVALPMVKPITVTVTAVLA